MIDGLLYFTKFNYTQSELLGFVDEQYKKGVVKNISIILNDVEQLRGYGYGYGYYEYDKA